MRATVVDASIVIKWVISEPDSAIAQALLDEWFNAGILIVAPALLAYEVTNVLYQRVRKDSMMIDEAEQTLAYVFQGTVKLNFSEAAALSMRAMQLAHQYTLPATYDAHYLALAEREKCEYWTADTRLWNAINGKLPWVRWLGDYNPPSA